MIEKLMKAVKSGNKKRGRNITIGAVVGFLLSCTAVMGADNYLLIKEDSGKIKFSTDNGISLDTDNSYDENTWNGIDYVNNITLSGTKNLNSSEGYGLRLEGNLGSFNFINNGVITGKGSYKGYGIYNDGGSITTLENSGLISVTGSTNGSYGIYNDGGSITTLKNSGLISATGDSKGYGIYHNGGTIETLTNSGLITGTGGIDTGYGIFKYSGSITILKNNGLISGTGSHGNSYGIYNTGSTTTLENSGLITGTGNNYGNGISNSDSITNLVNNGLITGTGGTDTGYGIYNGRNITTLANNGLITGTGRIDTGYGIYNLHGGCSIGTLTNTGVIFGTTNAIKNNGGTIKSANNYGILATKGSSAISGTIMSNNNYGLYIEDATGIVTAGNGGIKTVKIGDLERDMAIKNAVIQGGSGSGTSTDSFTFLSNPNKFDNSILNGKNETLKVSGEDREVKGSIINAYGTAVVFGEADKKLTLSGTIVNGGVDEANKITVSGSSGGDTLIFQSGEVEYVGGGTGTQNTVINGNIAMGDGADTITVDTSAIINGNVDMGDGDDVLNIAGGGKINGTLDGKAGNDTLNFGESGTAKTRANTADEINILHDISGFENININSNVTLFEKTIGSDGELKDLTVADVSNLTIGANGVLTLRIDSANGNKHALPTGNTGIIKSENGGKLLLALNGAGNEEIISFGNLALDGSLVTEYEGKYQEDVTFATTSVLHSVKRTSRPNEVEVAAKVNLPTRPTNPDNVTYEKLNKIYHSLCSPLVNGLENFNVDNDEKLSIFLGYLNDIYAGNPYSYSSELSRKSTGMFREIITENQFKANTGKWMIYGGLTHVDGGTKDTYYGKGYYTYDIGSSDMDADTKITGAYMLGEYGASDTLTSGVVIGGNKLKSDLSNGSKVDGSALYLGAYAKKYIGNLKVTAGAGFQYGDYDAERLAVNKAASDIAEPVMKYSDNYNDMTYDIYLNGRYSHNIGDNLFLEPYGTLSYTYIDQDGADEGSKALAIETDSKSFDYTSAKVGVDLKKVIPHEKGKSTLSAGVSYTKILDGADEEYITGRFKGGSDFDILVAHKNEHSIGLNAKYALELENGILFDVKGNYAVERDSHNGAGKNKTKGEWIVGAGLGYKF
ncbi:autotransporter family protein [Fusobacterium sp. THCT1E2]